MIPRIQKLNQSHSFFLFGSRGTGKSTLLRNLFQGTDVLWIDFLTEDEDRFRRHPDELISILEHDKYSKVIVDEIQKVPKFLDIIHKCMESNKKIQFIMTGSSSRKLKRNSANLLAGRAFVYNLYPFTHLELSDRFQLDDILNFGGLPKIFEYDKEDDKKKFLKSYARVYLKEEIQQEQIVRKIDYFRDFLEVAAQTNGQIINYSKISADVGIDDKTVIQYFHVLKDTLVGLLLDPYHRSVRKQQVKSSKFYFFDLGVKKALERSLDSSLVPQTFAYGKAFEHFIILECHRLNEYFAKDYRFFYLKDKGGMEIDLIIDRGRKSDILIEIKSSTKITDGDIKTLKKISRSWGKPFDAQLWSCDKLEKSIEGISCLYWKNALKKTFE